MAHLLGAEGLRLMAGPRVLLDGVGLGVDDGMRIGVLGRNGAGKSSLLGALAGRRPLDGGRVTSPSGTRIAVLDQKDTLPPGASVLDAVHGGLAEHEWAGDRAVRELHEGLISELSLDVDVDTLSGGQRRRVALASVLAAPAEVLVLDEPTNHLDVEGVAFLAAHLQERFASGRGALLVVTHDRWFLDAVCTRVWDVVPGHDGAGGRSPVPGHVEVYDGGYAAYVLARAERERSAAVAAQKRNNLLRKELAWLRRGAPARTSKPKFRLDAAAALIADEPPPRDSLALTDAAGARLGKDVLDLEGVTVQYDVPPPILDDVTWRLAPGERVGIVGANGAGKSTALRLLAGLQEPTSGRVRRGKTVDLAVLTQDTGELDEIPRMRVVEAVADVAEHVSMGGADLSASQLIERLGFARERQWTRVSELSGGERRRLQLLRLLVAGPNVLLLDEPTNDLDTDTLAAVEDLLDSWPGTLIVVSHDRYLLERVTDHQVAVIGGAIRDLPGGVEEYLALRRGQRASSGEGRVQAAGQRPTAEGGSGTNLAPGGAAGGAVAGGAGRPAGATDAAREREARKNLGRIERRMTKLSGQIERLDAQMAEAAEQQDVGRITSLAAQSDQLRAESDALEEEWLLTAEELEG
ncbi:ABC-F family ATP-binding cassette domain-containing protein [Georgenia sp. Z1344]|uniref:ABC-F family ATP-binding cassette domain-containing protein n=1 Tax=Georgenia sp. Z1344 TaxID=3416706 RepID=UPI003CE6FB80